MRSCRIRPAEPRDAPAIARMHAASALAAYRGMLPDDMLEGWYGLERRQQIWRDMLEAPPPGSLTRIAVEPGAVLGLCTTFAPSRDDDADGGTAEIAALYVDPARQRTGIGRALMGAALRALHAEGWRAVTLWVLGPNAAARAFYAAHGFSPDGGEHRRDGGLPSDVRLRRSLAGRPEER